MYIYIRYIYIYIYVGYICCIKKVFLDICHGESNLMSYFSLNVSLKNCYEIRTIRTFQ